MTESERGLLLVIAKKMMSLRSGPVDGDWAVMRDLIEAIEEEQKPPHPGDNP